MNHHLIPAIATDRRRHPVRALARVAAGIVLGLAAASSASANAPVGGPATTHPGFQGLCAGRAYVLGSDRNLRFASAPTS